MSLEVSKAVIFHIASVRIVTDVRVQKIFTTFVEHLV
jgi:hypothetical protein